MKELNDALRKLAHSYGISGILALIFLNFGFNSFIVNLFDLITGSTASVFGGPWGVLLFSCAMTSVWLQWPSRSKL